MPLLDRRVVEHVARHLRAIAPASGPAKRSSGPRLRTSCPRRPPRAETGFPVPIGSFLLEDQRRLVQRLLLSERTADRGLLDPDAVRTLVARPGSDRPLKLWTLASLELWCRANLDAPSEAPPASFAELLDDEPALAVA